MRAPVPFDILAYITEILGSISDTETLRALSLTCGFMVPLCRRHLFSSVSLGLNSTAPTEEIGLTHFLSGSPDVTRHIRKLTYVVNSRTPTSQHMIDVLGVLRCQTTSLQSISLCSVRWSDWDFLQESMKLLLVSLIQLPSVTHLQLQLLKNFPFVVLSLCSSLISISINKVSQATSSPYADHIITRSRIPAPESLYIGTFDSALSVLMHPPGPNNTVSPTIDFSRLKNASFYIWPDNEARQMEELLKVVTQLQTLIIAFENPLRVAGLGSILAANAYRTLKTVKLRLTVDEEHYDPLCGLTLELRQLSGRNVLEELEVSVIVEQDEPCRTDSSDWSDLDTVLTDEGAFPMLHRVTVNLVWQSYHRTEAEVSEVLRRLTQDQFPRLLESSAVQFSFDEMHEDL